MIDEYLLMRDDLTADVREFVKNASENGYDVLTMSPRELAEDLYWKAGVSQDDTLEDIERAVLVVLAENEK